MKSRNGGFQTAAGDLEIALPCEGRLTLKLAVIISIRYKIVQRHNS
jgi:hypothetical protein